MNSRSIAAMILWTRSFSAGKNSIIGIIEDLIQRLVSSKEART